MDSRIRLCAVMMMALLASAAAEASFTASDLVFVPVVAHSSGVTGSEWVSDVTITNVETSGVNIDVMLTFLPTGPQSNAYLFSSREYWAGGRADEQFGILDERLADIPPGSSVVIEDVVLEYWPDDASVGGSGALVIFAYEANSLETDGSRIPRNMVVNSRTYNQTTIWEPDAANEGEFIEVDATYGQVMPGVPWYNFADSGAVDENGDLSFMGLTGGEVNENFRYNLGVINGSDPLTTLTVEMQPLQADGSAFLTDEGFEVKLIAVLPPLAHIQYNAIYSSVYYIDEAEVTTIKVSIQSFTTSGVDAVPLLTTYGSIVDNRSNDPTTVLPTFTVPYNVDCMWGSGEPTGKRAVGGENGEPRVSGRPLEAPPVAGN